MMKKAHSQNEEENPQKSYPEERNNEGSMFGETPEESAARDVKKMDKALGEETQKMDGIHPRELEEDDDIAGETRRETLENK